MSVQREGDSVRSPLRGFVFSLRDRYLGLRLGLRTVRNALALDAPPPTDATIGVDPDDVVYTMSWNELSEKGNEPRPARFDGRKTELAGTFAGGDWDRSLERFENCIVYRSLRSHFAGGLPWEETELFRRVTARIADGEVWWGCETVTAFEKRCTRLDRLFERIRDEGYRTQRELDAESETLRKPRVNTVNRTVEGEVAVNVGRDGRLIFYDGRNRLSIAKILGIETIPVVVLVRHEQWQQLRDAVASGRRDPADLPPELRTHPDLADLR